MVRLYWALHVARIAQNVVTVGGFRDAAQTLQFTKNSCATKMKKKVVGGGRCTEGMYHVNFKKGGKQQALAAPE